MIYFDNAATTKEKPESVFDAFAYYVREVGVSPGRGAYNLGIEASRMLFDTRKTVGEYFGLHKSHNVVFTKNSTEAINLFFKGFLKKGDHVVITCYEHNAVLRPLHSLSVDGIIEYSVISREDLEMSPLELYAKYFHNNTRLFVSTLASNLTGRIVFRRDLFAYLKNKGVITFVDSSQGAGKISLNMQEDSIDCLAFTGHKDLMAIPGVGGLCVDDSLKKEISPLLQGGTGIFGDSYVNPSSFPDGLEAGTLNMPAIWTLNASVKHLISNRNSIIEKEHDLMTYLIDKLVSIKDIEIYDLEFERVSTVGINVLDKTSDEIVELLNKNDICVRGGIHCAILAHEALGTTTRGVVRISLSSFNNKHEIDELVSVLMGVVE